MMKLRPNHIQPVIMAGIMAFVMTGFVTWLNLGFREDFLFLWAKAYITAWPLASVAAFIAGPIAPKLTRRILVAVNGQRFG